MSNPTNLKVLEAALHFAVAVHDHFDDLDAARMPGIRTQVLRAADAVPANIAEGVRGTSSQRRNFYNIARGSADEVGAHLRLARRTEYISAKAYWHCENKRVLVCKMLTGLLRCLDETTAYEMDRSPKNRRHP